ncbi:MAG: putative PEP-binding protein [Leptolyngbyaceae cyanobacterium]
MGWLYPLAEVSQSSAADSGELAWRLAHLSRAGYPVCPTWVISTSAFEQQVQRAIAREPLWGEWPQLLWQSSPQSGHRFSQARPIQRLRQSLGSPNLDWSTSAPIADLAVGNAPTVLRLTPSLWLGEGVATLGLTQVLGEEYCWGDHQALSLAVKRIWAKGVGGRRWAYWRHGVPPSQLHFAVVVQAIAPTQVSGTLTCKGDDVTLQMVLGLPKGFNETIPDRYEGPLDRITAAAWRQGQQEQIYQPMAPPQGQDYFYSVDTTETALQRIKPDAWQPLGTWARATAAADPQPFHWHWQLPEGQSAPHITQAWAWPFTPPQTHPLRPTAGEQWQWVGRPASPGRVVAPAVVISAHQSQPAPVDYQIVVTTQIAPDWLPALKNAVAIVCEEGGLACHGAILARELGIPAVVGIPGITEQIQSGDQLRLDGDRGTLERIKAVAPLDSDPPSPEVRVPTHWDTGRTQLWVNLTQPESASSAAAWPVAGVGLLRSEWLIQPCLQQRHPYHWLAQGDGAILQTHLMDQLRPILAAFAPRPVRYRSLDLRSHELTTLIGGPAPETNPTLGVRGTFSYQQYPDLFQLELNALRALQQEGFTNVQLLLPFVRTVEEFRYCQTQVAATRLNTVTGFQLWIMAEVPSVLFLLPDYVKAGVQGIAIGSNDLTQLLLGVDRDQAIFSTTFDERHAAVQAAIAHLLQQAQSLELPTSICGMAPVRHPEIIPALIQNGITGISVDQPALAATAAAIAQAEAQLSH